VANTSSDYTEINITIAMMTADSFQQLQVHFAFSQAFCRYFCFPVAFWQIWF